MLSPAGRMNRGVLAWLAIVVPVWSVLVFCTYWEPIVRDGWGHYIWHLNNDLSLRGVWEFFTASYVHNNPRLGQTFTLIQHTPGALHPILTPLFELALFYLLSVLVLGRRPSLRRVDDALLFATIVAMVFACARSLGPMLFYRPYTGNYVFGLVVNLAWLVPYRLHAGDPERWRWRWWWWPAFAVLGLASGLCNEHTGPAFLAAGALALAVYWRRGERIVPWAWLGLAGMIAGAALLYYAPGQEIRYAGLATQQSTLERVVERGASGNGRIVALYLLYCAPLVLWLVLGFVARARGAVAAHQPRASAFAQLAMVGVAIAIVLTLLASPKQGDRLYFASLCLTCAACAGWVLAQLGRREKLVATALAAVVIAYVGARLVAAYDRMGHEFAARLAAIETAPKNTVVRVAPYSQKRSRYVLADDFEVTTLRAGLASVFQLAGIELTAPTSDTTPAQTPEPAGDDL